MAGKRKDQKRKLGRKELQRALFNVDKAVAAAVKALEEWSSGMEEKKNGLREVVRLGLKIRSRILALVVEEECEEGRSR